MPSVAPVWRNLALLHERGVYLEVSTVYHKGEYEEIRETAARVASLSKDIPFQVMRFMPFGDATGISQGVCLDLESGPAMLAVAVARMAPEMKVVAVDFSDDSREIAQENI